MPRSDEPTATDNSSAADEAATPVRGGPGSLADLERRLAPDFERAEPRRRALASRRGWLSPGEGQKSWQLAEVSGDAPP
jgi:hypothetical protein